MAGERRQGREEKDAREEHPPGMAGDCQGARPRRVKGQGTSAEGNRDPLTSAVQTCVHAGRRLPSGRKHCGKGGGRNKKKKKHRRRANSTERVDGGRTGRSKRCRRGATGGAQKKTTKSRKRHGYRGWGQEEEPPTGQERDTPPKEKAEGRERPVLGARNGRVWMRIQWARAKRVARGPVGYKHRMMGKGDGTEDGVWLRPHNSLRRMGSRRGGRNRP